MGSILEHIQKEWGTLKGAPLAFFVLLFLGLALGGAGGHAWRGQEVANLESLMRLKDGELTTLTKQMEERLKKVEDRLSEQQVTTLESSLREIPSKIEIVKSRVGGLEPVIAGQLETVFSDSGWKVLTDTTPTEPANWTSAVLLGIPESPDGAALKAAFDAANIPYDVRVLPSSETAQIWLKATESIVTAD
ncbi:hypothetical protein [Devosia aquimaris]|uniref:hypothetical protein n=1 Tax=Devosia aquimaris TaxID=2866214 RepID=UPI001CD07053|nr:hypothetical protein [Devosia sp. CJK-A8-3]